ncbi:MAG: hypothetical protein AAF198_04630 [Pseudomonadota bacterium]
MANLLAILFPQPDDSSFADKLRVFSDPSDWLHDLLIEKLNKDLKPEDAIDCNTIEQLGSVVSAIACPIPQIWKLSEIPMAEFKQFQTEFKAIYATKGNKDALTFLNETRNGSASQLSKYLRFRFPG